MHVSSEYHALSRLDRRKPHFLPILVILALAAYLPAIDNFFTWDDFVWLQKSATLMQNPWQMFAVEVIYFDPLVYISFWINYLIAPFDFRLYHAVDIVIHSMNGLLLWYLVRRLTADEVTSFLSGIIFTTSFATVDAVVWSSSRVDLLAVFFSLVTLIAYHRYLTEGSDRLPLVPLVAYLCALGAKGTPVVIPGIMAVMLVQSGMVKTRWRSLLPFVAVTLAYLAVLFVNLARMGKGLTQSGSMALNLKNLMLAFTDLFVPERFVASALYPSCAVAVVIVAATACIGGTTSLIRTRRLGLMMIAAGLLPVLVLNEFKLPTAIDNAGYLLNSPSHRIYLASAGMALVYGSLWGEFARRLQRRTVLYPLIVLFVLWNVFEIQLRERLWDGSARYIRSSVEGIATFKGKIHKNSVVGLAHFPMSRGFMQPVLFLYCGVENELLLPMTEIPAAIPDAPEILRHKDRASFFVYGNQVHDLSQEFNSLLSTAFRYQTATNPAMRAAAAREYVSKAGAMNDAVKVLRTI